MTDATSPAVSPAASRSAAPCAHLEITARPAPELLERLARVLRHRGATVERLSFDTSPADTSAADTAIAVLRADLRCPTPLAVLVNQLRRLPDVHSVEAS
jgi:acetolactate synthase regulatory subunit